MSSTLSSSHAEGVTFQIGDRFNTFEELECKLKLYENATSTKFWMRDCRTVNAAARKRTTRPLSDFIKYYQVSYRCIHGGRKFVPKRDRRKALNIVSNDLMVGGNYGVSLQNFSERL